jgi:hypothetical protein
MCCHMLHALLVQPRHASGVFQAINLARLGNFMTLQLQLLLDLPPSTIYPAHLTGATQERERSSDGNPQYVSVFVQQI